MSDYIRQNSISFKLKVGDIWAILSPIEMNIKEKIEKYGIPLEKWPNLKINYGIKTGCNEAFIIDENKRNELLDNCTTQEERERTDKLIRPILRGRDIKRNSYDWAGLYLIASHNGYIKENGESINRVDIAKYPSVKKHLDGFNNIITGRTDQGDTPYNLRSCAYMDDFDKPKIIYSEIVKEPQFYYDLKKFYPEASTFFIAGSNLEYLIDILNSKLYSWVFKHFYSGGGLGEDGYRYKKIFLEKMHVPITNDSHEKINFIKTMHFNEDEINYLNELKLLEK